MLIIHPSSQCDVCLDAYNWTTPANAPHAIACGHVFCLQCLRTLNPSICPLCRKAFQRDRVKKLHIDRLTTNEEQDFISGVEEANLLQRVALFFGENTPDEDVNAVIAEVQEWLASRSDNPSTHRALRAAIDALHRYKLLQQDSRSDKAKIEYLHREHDHRLRMKEHDLQTARAVEENLLEKIHNIEEEFNGKLAQAEAELATFRAERTQTRHEFPRLSERPNPLPYAPDLSRSQNISNPLPRPPHAVTPERFAPLARPLTSMSGQSMARAPSIHGYSGSDRSSSRAIVDRGHSPDHFPVMSESEEEELRRSDAIQPPLIIPGAPSARKVVPPPPTSERDLNWRNSSRTDEHSFTSTSTASHSSGSSGSAPARADPSSTPYGYQYGYVPGQGYALYRVPWSTAGAASDSVRGAGISSTDGHSHPNTRPIYADSSVVQQPTTFTNMSSETIYNQGLRHAQNASRGSSVRRDRASMASGVVVEQAYNSTTNSNTSSVSSTSLRNMSLLGPSPRTRGQEVNNAEHRDILDLLGVNTAQPSPASTWGTVHSSQIPSRNSNGSNISDLGLVGLPSVPDEYSSDDEDSEDAVSVARSDGDGDVIAENFMTPRRGTLPYGQMASPRQSQPAQAGHGLGLTLSNGSGRASAGQVINGQHDLRIVSQSLMQFVDRDGRGSRGDRDLTRHSTSSDQRETPEHILGSRTGVPLYMSRPQSRVDEEARSSSRAHNGTPTYRRDRGSASDSEHAYWRSIADHDRSQSRVGERHQRRHSSMIQDAVIPPPVTHIATSRQPSAASRVSDRENAYVRFESPPDTRERRNYHDGIVPPASAVDVNGFVPALGQSSLLLSFPTTASTMSVAVNGRGEESGIRAPAPRPVSSRHNSLFGLWNARNGR